jgi:hypothetical protein
LQKEEAACLLAVLETFSMPRLVVEHATQEARRFAGAVATRLGWSLPLPQTQRHVEQVEQRVKELSQLSSSSVRNLLLLRLSSMADFQGQDDDALAHRIGILAAEEYGVPAAPKLTLPDLEKQVVEQFVKDSLDRLREQVAGLSEQEVNAAGQGLDQRFSQMSGEERNSVRQALGLHELSGQAFLSALRSGALTGGTLVALGCTGFGVYLATSTLLHTLFTTILGITLPFSVYMGASSVLHFILGPGLIPVACLAALGPIRRRQKSLTGRLLALCVALGCYAEMHRNELALRQ